MTNQRSRNQTKRNIASLDPTAAKRRAMANAKRQRKNTDRRKAGLVVFRCEVHEATVIDALLQDGRLAEGEIDIVNDSKVAVDAIRKRVTVALERLLADWARRVLNENQTIEKNITR